MKAMSKAGSDSRRQNRKDRMMKSLSITLVTMLVAGIFVAILSLLWFDGPSPIFAQTDTTAPTVSSVAITSDPDENDADLGAYIVGRSGGSIVQSTNWASGVYRIGDDVKVTVTFSENVTVTGSPQLELAIGSNNRTAGYESTEGGAVVFSYTVAVGDSDSDGISVAANKLTLNGGSIKDTANNDADLSHNTLAAQDGHKVDGVRPRLKLTASDRLKFMASSGGSDGAYTTGEELIIRAVFTEGGVRGSVTGPPRVTLNLDGGGTRVAKWDPSLIFNPTQYPLVQFFSYVVQEGDLDSNGPTISANAVGLAGGFIRDAAGNDAILTHLAVAADSTFIVDAVAPTVSSIAFTSDPGDDGTYGTGDKIEVTVTFSENMSIPTSITCSSEVVHCKAELELDIGGTARTADYQSHDGAEVVYAYTVQAGDTDDNGISIGANKLTGQRIMDATGKFGYAINDADLSHDTVADDPGHKVATSSQPPESADATLSGLTLSRIVIVPTDDSYNPRIFRPILVNYTASVAYSLTETTVTPTVNDLGASYVIKLGGVTDADGTVSIAVGSNVITIEVTAEDGETTKTYTVTVTRASAVSTNATLKKLNLSGIDIGTGMGVEYISGSHTSYSANVYHSVSQTTVTATPNHSAASYVIKLGGVADPDGVITLGVGRNVVTVDVTAEDGQTTKTYTVTVTRATQSAPTTGELSTDDPQVNFRTMSYSHSFVALAFNIPKNRGIIGDVIQRFEHDGDKFVSAGADGHQEYLSDEDLGGLSSSWSYEAEPDTLYKWVVKLVNSQNATVIQTSLTVRTPPDPGSTTLSSDATLSDLTLSGIEFEATDRAFISTGFHDNVVSYVARVANSVTQTTVNPTVNHPDASYVIKLGGVTDADGVVALSVGSNVITVEVTAEDDSTTRTYTVTVTRAEPTSPEQLSNDAALSALTLSGVDFGTFDSTTTSYTAQVANSITRTTVTPTVSDSGASYLVKLGGVTDADGVVALSVGSNVITVEVTAEDDSTTRTYTVTVTRADATAPDTLLQRMIDRYDANNNGAIEKNEVINAINDYLFGEGDEAISKAEVIRLINVYLFG